MGRGKPLGLLAAASLLLLSPQMASSHATDVKASGVITASGTTYVLTIANTGGPSDGAIGCFGFQAVAGVTITGATGGPPGFSVKVFGNGQSIGGGPGLKLAPGQTVTFQFTTAQPYPAGAGGTLFIAPDPSCQPDSTAPVSGPNAQPPPPPPPPTNPTPVTPRLKPCKCAAISVKLDGTLLNKKGLRPDKHDFGVGFVWSMVCTKGDGGCSASLTFSPPVILAGTLPKPKNNLLLNLKVMTFLCKANCGGGKSGKFQIQMLSRDQLNTLFGRTLAYTVTTHCGKVKKEIKVTVFVDEHGVLRPGRR